MFHKDLAAVFVGHTLSKPGDKVMGKAECSSFELRFGLVVSLTE